MKIATFDKIVRKKAFRLKIASVFFVMAFSFVRMALAAPTVSNISPTSGTTLGGTPVTITGSGFIAGDFGNGNDGAITISANKNLNTDTIAAGRTCADATNYSVTALTTNSATLSATPAAGCLVVGDEVLLINLQGISTNYANVGNYETLKIQAISTNTITFLTNKTKYYGNGASDDTNIGTSGTNQKVMLQRIPTYTNVTVDSSMTLTANSWDGTKGGVLYFKANGTVTNNGTIDMSGKGFRGGIVQTTGEGYAGTNLVGYGGGVGGIRNLGTSGCAGNSGGGGGGGGAYGANGSNGQNGPGGNGGAGGSLFGVSDLGKLFLGGAGGGGGYGACGITSGYSAGTGGNGGGIIVVGAKTVTNANIIKTDGTMGTTGPLLTGGGAGGGAGGGIRIMGTDVIIGANNITAAGASGTINGGWDGNSIAGNGGNGGAGRVATYYNTSLSGSTVPIAYSLQQSFESNFITILFGSDLANNVLVTSPTTITAMTPVHGAGATDVIAMNSDGQSATLTNGYTFNAPPTITTGAVSPSSAKLIGGDTITITGTGFYGTPTVTLGGTAATAVNVVNSTTLTATTPAHALGLVDVVVTNPDLQSATLTNGFTFTELPPTVSQITPDNGSAAGGTNVTITGTNFLDGVDSNTKLLLHGDGNGATFVDSETTPKTITASGDVTQSSTQSKFGGKAIYFDGSGDYLSLIDSADWAFGTGDLTIEFWLKTTSINANLISQIPSNGVHTTAGFFIQTNAAGKVVFTPDYRNYPGNQLITSTNAVNDDNWHHLAIIRNGAFFRMYVDGNETGTAVNLGAGFSMTDSSDFLRIGSMGAPENYAPYNGYIDELRISKGIARWTSNFASPLNAYAKPAVSLGGSSATNIAFVNANTITATTPVHAAGATDVVVTNYDGQSVTLTNGYIYNPAPTISAGAVSPSSAKLTGGDTITITGTGFYGTPTVTLGGTAATAVNVVNSTTITATTPAHAVGQVDVVVTNQDSQSVTLINGFTFTELPPTLSQISPDNGPSAGGTSVTITGTNFFPKNTGGDASWATVAGKTLPGNLTSSQLATVGNNLYLLGGYNGTAAVSSIYTASISDPTTWTVVAGKTLPGNLYNSQLAAVGNNLYLFGGNNGAATNVIYTASISDPTTWTVVAGKTLPGNLLASQLAVVGNNLYLFGGNNGAATNVIYTASISDPTTWTVVAGKTLPGNLYNSQLAIVGNNMYLLGGYNGTTGISAIYTASISDPTTWTTVSGKTLPGNLGTSQFVIIGDNLYLLGGYDGSASKNVIYTALVSDPTTWTTSASTLPAILRASNVAIVDSNIYLFGGITSVATNAIYRAPVSHFRGNVFNKSWLTSWPTVLSDQSNVTIGGVSATNINFTNSTTATATTAANVSSNADVVVTNYDGQSATLPGAFEYHNWITRGTYTSTVKALANTAFGVMNWNASTPTGTGITMRVKSCTTADCSDKTSWTGCDLAAIDNGTDVSGKGCVVDGQGFVQYQAYLTTDLPSVNPYLDSVTIFDQPQYATAAGKLVSSPYDTGDMYNAVSRVTWSATNDGAQGTVKMQIRTAPDNGSGVPDFTNSLWCGPTDCAATPNSTNSFATSYYTDKTGATVINSVNRDSVNDQWVEYATFLNSSDGNQTPTLSDISLSYVVNAPPELQNIAAVQEADGTVSVAFDVRDPDTENGATENEVNIGFEYCSANCSVVDGETWTAATNISGNVGAGVAVQEATWSSGYQIQWNAKLDYPNRFNETDFKVRVRADDGEAANSVKYSNAGISVFDTKNPTLGFIPIIVDATSSPATVTLDATDDTDLQMKVSTSPTLSGANWESFSATKTITLSTSPSTVYAQFIDEFGNASPILSVTTPEVPTAMMIQDTSNMNENPFEFRLFTAWKVAVAPSPGFASYKVYRSPDQANWTLVGTVNNRLTNYFADNTVSGDTNYYYRVSTNDLNGNISAYSSIVNGKANGTQDAGEGGGGAGQPVISGVTVDQITNVSARINWTTDVLSNSTVGYSTTGGNFVTETGVGSMVTSHSVTVGNLSPSTQYYFQTKSIGATNLLATDANGGNGYTFTTAAGDSVAPVISSISVPAKTSSTATIIWSTDENSNSFVEYSKTSGFATGALFGNYNLLTSHSVTVPSLEANAVYYFRVRSKDASNNESVSSEQSFTTDPSGDIVDPIISSVSSVPTFNSALISWTTDENATSYVEYGTTVGYGRIFGDGSMATDHDVQLPYDLLSETGYHFRVRSTDGSGNESISIDNTFTTTADTNDVTAPVISNVVIGSPTTTSVTLSWNTNENATSFAGYSLDGGNTFVQQGSSAFAAVHSVTLVGLTPNTNYLLKIISTDTSANTAVDDDGGEYYSVATPLGPQAPTLSSISAESLAYDGATITWNSGSSATSFVEYGLDTNYGQASGKYVPATSHSIALKNLLPGQTYHFRVRSATEVEAISGDYTFSTLSAPDSTPPVVSSINAVSSVNTLQINWNTNEAATSYVEYGMDTNYGSIFGNNTLLVSHSVQLPSDLAQNTTYHYRIRTSDALGNLAVSGDNIASTLVDPSDVSAPSISNLAISSNSVTTITATWNTDEDSTSYVAYSLDGTNFVEQGSATFTQNHSVTIVGLSPNTNYELQIKSSDALGNVAIDDNGGANHSQATQNYPNAPVISAVGANVSGNDVTINWTTDINADSQVEYGTDTNYGAIAGKNDSTTNHSVTIKGFSSSTIYHYRLHSTAATERVSSDYLFVTAAAPDTSAPIVSNIAATPSINTIQVDWNTNELATSYVEYGTDTNYGNIHGSNILTMDHSIQLPYDLAQNTVHHYRVRTADSLGNLAVSADNVASTLVNPTDVVDPVISNVAITSNSVTTITATWNTNENSTSYVAYSLDGTNFVEQGSATLTQNHSVTIVGLSPNTGYELQIKSSDAFGNVAIDDNGGANFAQTTQNLPNAPQILNLNVTPNIDGQSATLTWTTDISSDSQIEYGADANYGSSFGLQTETISHSVTVKNLAPNTTYHYRAHSSSTEAEGVSSDQTFTTLPPPDSMAPVISGITFSGITSSTATITWNTNKNTDSILHYGTTSNYTKIAGNKNASENTHSVQLSELAPNTTYHYIIEAKDEFGNVTESSEQTFVTAIDTSNPNISNINVLATTQTSAVISWETDKDASTAIIYGKDHDLTLSANTTLFGKTHFITISDLEKGTKYYFKVVSVDASLNVGQSAERDFESGVDASLDHDPLETITFDEENPSILTDTAAVISFTTDQVANCYVKYGTVSGSENYTYTPVTEKADTFNKTHAIALTGMLFSTKHYYVVTCHDNLPGALEISSEEKDFTTEEKSFTQNDVDGLDSLAPVITNVKIGATTGESAIITWDTNENASSTVGYGISTVDEKGATDQKVNNNKDNYITSHSVTLNGLIPATKYIFTAMSSDASGNISESSESSFTTQAPSSLSSINVVSNDIGQATITWKTNQDTTSTVEYGLSTSYGEKKESSSYTKEHSINISNLSQGVTYHYRVKGQDKDGMLFASSDQTFEPKSPAKITDIKLSDINEHGATVSFKTNIPTDANVTYTDTKDNQKTGSQGIRELSTDHKIELSNLEQGTTFAVNIEVRDEQGTQSSLKAPDLTTGQDNAPPVIDNVKTDSALAQSDKVQSIISWRTDEQATTAIVYKEGSTGEEREIKITDNLTTSHIAVITAFKSGTVYNFKVKSIDASGNQAVSKDFALLTPKKSENIIQIIINNFQQIFGWANR